MEPGILYVFGAFELAPQGYELQRAGVPQALERQGFNVLVYLVEHRERVVPKDEFLAQLWPRQRVRSWQRMQEAQTLVNDSYVVSVEADSRAFLSCWVAA